MQLPQDKLREEFRKEYKDSPNEEIVNNPDAIFDWFEARMIPVEVVREAMQGARAKRIDFLEYSSKGYSGGEDGLRCTTCDRKYSGIARVLQLCTVCRFTKEIDELSLLASLETLQSKK